MILWGKFRVQFIQLQFFHVNVNYKGRIEKKVKLNNCASNLCELLYIIYTTILFPRLFFIRTTELTTLRANTLIMKTLEEEVTGLNARKDELNERINELESGKIIIRDSCLNKIFYLLLSNKMVLNTNQLINYCLLFTIVYFADSSF